MITENLSNFKINKLTQQQYNRELLANNIDETAFYLTPDTGTTYLGVIDDIVPLSVEALQEIYDFKYYNSLDTAIADVNADTIGSSEDATKDNANIGVYISFNNEKVIVLLKDTTIISAITITKDMVLKLGGKCLSVGTGASLTFSDTLTNTIIDARLEGSKIEKVLAEASTQAIEHLLVINGRTSVKGGSYKNNIVTANTAAMCFNISATGNVDMSNCIIKAATTNTLLYTI